MEHPVDAECVDRILGFQDHSSLELLRLCVFRSGFDWIDDPPVIDAFVGFNDSLHQSVADNIGLQPTMPIASISRAVPRHATRW